MYQLFNRKTLQLIPIVFLIVIVFRITYAYNEIEKREYEFAKSEAEVLSSFAFVHRDYYQKLYINKSISLDKKSLQGLPAYSSYPISEIFSKNNSLNILLITVSDRARNIKNNADSSELKAIKYFRENKKETQYFTKEENSFYQYAKVLKIENKCLKCHGKKSDAPKFIQERYDNAYNYKLGEVRGIQSIKIPVSSLNKYFMKYFYQSVIYDIILFILLFIAIFFITKKSNNINKILEEKIEEKTQELKSQMVQDRLTKYPNRTQLFWDIEDNLEEENQHLALLNIDRFKNINDFYGHNLADVILINIANEIHEKTKEYNLAFYKLPSDEFAILSSNKMKLFSFNELIKQLIHSIHEKEFTINNSSVYVNLSCGIASDEADIITKADMALQHAKSDHSKTIVSYDKSLDMADTITNNINGIKLLKDAIENEYIKPYYQPIYNVSTRKITKYESLARIITNDGVVIPPYSFIDISKKSNLYPDVTKAMIKKSFAYFENIEHEFSLNLSIDDIENKDTVIFIVNSIKNFPEPNRIIFEIIESDRIDNYEKLRLFIEKIKNFGCKFAIDDFGSGYSNFAHILELNVDYLKIDASLVKNITTDENSKIITKTIINFAASLGLETIAEYVEDKESLDILEEMGVNYIQGYYIGKPSPEIDN